MPFNRRSVAWMAAGLALLAVESGRAEPPQVEAEPPYSSMGKPGAPVELSYTLREEPSAGVPLTIDLAVFSRIPADELTLEINFPDAGLTLVAAPDERAMRNPAAGEPLSQSIRVLPREEGEFHVNVIATLVRDGVSQARAFSIPVRVGRVPLAATESARLKTDAAGHPLVSLPAIETGTGL